MKKLLQIPDEMHGMRLDVAISQLLAEYSRSRLQQWIKQGLVTLDSATVAPRSKVSAGQNVEIEIDQQQEEHEFEAEDIPLHILHDDDDIIVLNKPAGLVVHPAAGNWQGTLLNGLVYRYPELKQLPRAGIVHRLDKDTSGIMVVARSLKAHSHLVNQLQTREMGREYQAIVQGEMITGGKIDAAIGRHPVHRKKMAVVASGKPAVTHYRILQRLGPYTHVRVRLETGRTHQIRVHMAHIGYPLLGDRVYAGRKKIPSGVSETYKQAAAEFPRQALHAKDLTLIHPSSGKAVSYKTQLADDYQQLLALMQDG